MGVATQRSHLMSPKSESVLRGPVVAFFSRTS